MKLQLARILIIQFIGITYCVAIQYNCDRRNVSCGCGFKNVELNEENNNAEEAIPHSWSMMVSIRYDCHYNGDPLTHCCGGTILSDSYILTTARCFDLSYNSSLLSNNITIAASIHNLSQKCQTIRVVDQIFIHPNWTSNDPAMHNIAILRLAEPLDFQTDYFISPACFSSQMNIRADTMHNNTLAVIGWSVLDNSNQMLQQLTVYPIDYNDSLCARSVDDSKLLFCAGRNEAPCFPEVGGPLYQWIGDRWELVGIESYAMDGCTGIGYKGLFVRVAAYYDWIQSIVYPGNDAISSTISVTTEQISTTTKKPLLVYECNRNTSCGCSYSDVAFSLTRIVGGEDAIDYSWSMIASLRFYGTEEHSCAGTLLSSSYVLTAAHCVDHFTSASPANITVVAGITNRSDSDRYIRKVDQIYLHPNYTGSPNFLNNIALLHIDRPLYFVKNPILAKTCVHRINSSSSMDEQHTENGTRLVVIGWGAMRPESFVLSEYLKQIQVYAIDNDDQICKDIIGDSELQFCAGFYEGGKDACLGDSGGPILYWTGQYWEQVGVIGHSFSCGRTGSPGIYNRLSYYWQWMEDILTVNNEHLEPYISPSLSTSITSRLPPTTASTSSDFSGPTTVYTSSSDRTATTTILTYSATAITSSPHETTTAASWPQETTATTSSPLITKMATGSSQTMTTTNSSQTTATTTSSPQITSMITSRLQTTNTTIFSPQKNTPTTVPLEKITYECNRIPDECGCSLTNVAISGNNQQLSTNRNEENAYPYSWSMIVSIRVDNMKHTCIGTILSDSFILTTAQCVSNGSKSNDITVAAGIHSLSQYITSVRKVEQVYIYENYTNNIPHLHNIALLRLEQPLELTTQPIFAKTCLSGIKLSDSIGNSRMMSVGWRHSEISENVSDTLQQVSVATITNSNSTCFDSNYNDTYQFCAGLMTSNTGSCESRFGEPIFVYRDKYWEQVGILSHAYGCMPTGHSGIYIRLSAYVDWIQGIMQNTSIPIRQSLIRNTAFKQKQNILLFNILLFIIKMFY